MEGQLSLFDIHRGPRKPCEYGFKRYIGQKVHMNITEGHVIGKVVKIEPYYTIIEVEGMGQLAGTPTTFGPENKEEWDDR